MKKILSAILALAAILTSLTSCDDDGYVEYVNEEIGIAYTIYADMEEPFVSRNTITTQNEDGSILFVINWFEVASLEKTLGVGFTIADYVYDAINDLGIADATDVRFNREGTRASFEISTAQTEEEIPQYLFHLIVKGSEYLYVIQYGCSEGDRELYESEFKQLATKIYTFK